MRVLVIDPISSGSAYDPILRSHGLDPILVDTDRALTAGLRVAPTAGALSFADDFGADPAALARHCIESEIGWLIVGAESAVPLGEDLRAMVPAFAQNHPENPERRWDKAAMALALAAAGVQGPETRIMDSLEHVKEFAETLRVRSEWAFVVKPSIGAGTVNVRKVQTEAELLSAAEAILNQPGMFGDQSRVLVQEFHQGREFVIDTVSHDGIHHVVALCTYDKRPSSLGSFVYERLRWLSDTDPLTGALRDYATNALDALGVQTGVGHMEVIMTDGGPRLIDFGARPHGAGHPLKTFYLTGNSQIHAEASIASAIADGTTPTIKPYGLRKHGAIAFFNISEPLQAHPIINPTRLLALDGVIEATVNLNPGGAYPETHTLLDGLDLGLAFIESQSPDQLNIRCTTIQNEFLTYFEQPTLLSR